MSKWYLGGQANESLETTPTDSQSTTLPAGTANPQSWLRLRLNDVAGVNDSLGNVTSLAQTARQDARIKPWLSRWLGAQTIAAQTWTFGFAAFEANAAMNAFICLVLYVWRPSTAAKVGTIYDSATALGTEYEVTNQTGRVVTFAGAAVTAEKGDILVLEVWQTGTQSMATSYASEFAFNGSTEPTEGVANTNTATYLSCPDTLAFMRQPPIRVRMQAVNRAASF